ncbi:unnamed protein product [Rotaria sordida]|uniref:RING-type domain-containing protein n=1 Tax=Rotaria sordida TaxID=392033 RepID=A0A818WM59_9BILA|nr:unnamed protein product [Rotaria sordida]CAF0891459.1 unnamed protein product [Rotaria sordida]CAF3718249.1 unnamed protein product [Rotaria sordida]CAF3728142.1 unnamed protein product [Rotaria sordida]
MSTSSIDNGVHNITNSNCEERAIRNNDDRINSLENGLSPTTNQRSTLINDNNERTWINSFNEFDRILSGSLLHLFYRLIDIIILIIGLSSTKNLCYRTNRLVLTSICLLIFYLIDLIIIIYFFFYNKSSNYRRLSEEEKIEQLRRVSALRGIFIFFKLIPVAIGTAYTLTSKLSETNNCELIRFSLGIVCVSTLLIMVIPPTKPELPTRRSLIVEGFILSWILIINLTYIATIGSSMKNVQHSSCIYYNSTDIYLGAPLKTYAYIGFILFSCTTLLHIIHLLISQLCYRLTNGRQLYIYYYGLQYFLTYFGALIVVYYFSVGALFLFQPRLGQPCRENAPTLYKTLLIWQWIRILFPLLVIPLILILCCLGVFFGIILSYCLPASITVPILELLRGWLAASPVPINPNPPATQENIDALPVVLFGQQPDQFNQTECAICQTNFEANEPVKKLDCEHLFHAECVTNWLLITRICPVCRRQENVELVDLPDELILTIMNKIKPQVLLVCSIITVGNNRLEQLALDKCHSIDLTFDYFQSPHESVIQRFYSHVMSRISNNIQSLILNIEHLPKMIGFAEKECNGILPNLTHLKIMLDSESRGTGTPDALGKFLF